MPELDCFATTLAIVVGLFDGSANPELNLRESLLPLLTFAAPFSVDEPFGESVGEQQDLTVVSHGIGDNHQWQRE